MAKKEYEIVDHDSIENLKTELDRLRSGQKYEETKDPTHLIKGMNDLSENLERFAKMFETATQEMRIEEDEQKFMVDHLNPLTKMLQAKMETILMQNEQIAKGIVAVADMLRQDLPALKSSIIQLQQSSQIQEPTYTPSYIERPPIPPAPMPSAPDLKKRKFGLF